MSESVLSRVISIEERIAKVEKESNGPIERVKRDLKQREVFSYAMKRVPADYYDRPIEYRAEILQSSVPQLCKSILLMNTACKHDSTEDPTDSKYYCLIIQYNQKLNSERLRDFVHRLR